ncbi:FMN-binding protein [Streptomyces blattellae]|uniref:FMN-binding protein n=1 Tax=Streptomyces blattellae TaxID=2569855 RepID=UPI0012B71708|nr:FMN-binding protein [Streptomyces blattellae]
MHPLKKNRPLRRIVLASATTVTGMVMLLALKPHEAPEASAAPAPAPSSAPSSGPTADSGGSGGSSTGTRTITGDSAQTIWGPVQVRITVEGGRLTDVTAIVYPQADPFETALNQSALPQLEEQALATQSADIDTVSGATYTSDGYRQSLQSALDSAGL